VINVHTTPQTIVVTLAGEFDISGVAALRHALNLAVSGEWRVAVVECARMSFVDVAGARPLAEAASQARATLTQLYLLHPSEEVSAVLDFMGLADRVVSLEMLPAPALGEDWSAIAGAVDLGPGRSGR
jgi:anti-anti-sigma factor